MTSKLIASLALAMFVTLLMPASDALARCCGASCCLIDGTCRTTGEVNPDNACEMCDPSSAGTAWTTIDGCGDDAGTPEEDAGMSMDEDAGMSMPDEDMGTPAGTDMGTPAGTDMGTSSGTDAGTTGDDSGDGDDGGCAAGGSGAFGGLFGLLLLGLRRKKGTL